MALAPLLAVCPSRGLTNVFDINRADKNPVHCLFLTWKTEGFFGLYRGTLSHLLRIAPHTVRVSFRSLCAQRRPTPYRVGLRSCQD